MLGTAGLPHILMRFYTVPDAQTARTSVGYATAFIGFFYLLTFILGFGAMVHHRPRRDHRGRRRAATWRRRCWPEAVGGTPFLGFIAAVAFATILAVVAGLTLSGAATLSHDLWVNVVRGAHADEREQLVVARVATVRAGASCRSCSASRSRGRTSPTWWAWRSRSPPAPTSRRWCCRSSGSG